jgi:hypothetical protein
MTGLGDGPRADRELIFSARGAVQRLGYVIEELADDSRGDPPDWLDEAGRVALWARNLEEITRLLVRIAEYVRELRSRGHELDPVPVRGSDGDWADLYADLVLEGTSIVGAAYPDSIVWTEDRTIKDLRNSIEHHADYLAGRGRRSVADIEERLHFTYTLDPFKLVSFRMFGHEYEVGGAIDLAFQLLQPLEDLDA